jgi:hypothetical protein
VFLVSINMESSLTRLLLWRDGIPLHIHEWRVVVRLWNTH